MYGILTNKTYIGEWTYGKINRRTNKPGVLITVAVPPIIEQELWDAAHAALAFQADKRQARAKVRVSAGEPFDVRRMRLRPELPIVAAVIRSISTTCAIGARLCLGGCTITRGSIGLPWLTKLFGSG